MLVAMEDLAPDITRQRLLIEGFFTIDVDEGVIRAFFERITTEMQLRTYGAPTIFAPEGDGRALAGDVRCEVLHGHQHRCRQDIVKIGRFGGPTLPFLSLAAMSAAAIGRPK